MRKAPPLYLLLFIYFFLPSNRLHACGYNYISSCATQLDIEADGQIVGMYIGNCTYLNNFNNWNFGTVNALTIDRLSELTWESCTNRVINTKAFYRIYPVGATPGSFQALNIPQSNVTATGDYRNRTFEAFPNQDLLSGLTNGTTYTLELYYTSEVDFDNNNTPDFTMTRNNAGANYKATFKKGGAAGGLTIAFPTKNNVSCSGGNNGLITASATGGLAPYTYAWSNGASGPTIQNLTANTYMVTVTAANGITGASAAVIVQPQPLAANITATDETNAAANNGTATATASGGTPPYNYAWNTGANSPNLNGLNAGTYTVTVTDSKNCQSTQLATVNTAGTVVSGYCAVTSSFPWNEWIGQVTLETLNNTSDKSPYSNFTSLSAPNLTAGEIYPITLKTGSGWFGAAESWRVWIDYNRNGIFENNEVAVDAQNTPPTSGLTQLIVNQNITIPALVNYGLTRMRVAIKRGAAPLPCENLAFGEMEDYHVNLIAPSVGGCSITANISNNICNDNGTNANPADDKFNFTLTVAGIGTGTGWSAIINGTTVTGTYGVAKNLGPYNISGGALSFTVQDNGSATCKKTVVVTPPTTCSNNVPCSVFASVSNIQCDNNGTTGTGTDDRYTFTMNVSGTGTGTGWTATINGVAAAGNYGSAQNFGPFNISAGTLTFTVRNAQNATCTFPVSVNPPAPCSAAGAPTNYCATKSDFPWHEWISKVNFAGINNATGKWFYTDYSNISGSVVRGQSYPITLSTSFSWDVISPHYRIWIDYNRDGVFQEPAEIAYSGIVTAANGTQDAPLNGTISIPATALAGATRMRVSLARNTYPSPCEALIPYGEVEDYSINIAASLLANVADRTNHLQIVANAGIDRNHIQILSNTLSPVQHARLEKAGDDFEWQTLQEWDDIYLPELQNVTFDTYDEKPNNGYNHYRLVLGMSDGNIVYSNTESLYSRPTIAFSIFPNPSSGNTVFVNLEKMIGKEAKISVYHSTGKQIQSETILNVDNEIWDLDVSTFSTGEYFLNIQSAQARPVTKKFVVIHED